MLDRIKRWWLLRKAKKEEQKHIPTEKEIKNEHKRFMRYAKKPSNKPKKNQ